MYHYPEALLLMAFWGSVIFRRLGALPIPCPIFAKVAELVDAQDLGSCGFVPWGFESPLSHSRPIETGLLTDRELEGYPS